jgi:poly(A) polymerase
LLGREAKDYDVATTATPEEVRGLFGSRRTLLVGVAFGVVRVLGPRGVEPIEVATFRQDMGYSDHRRPDAVEFSTPEADALRRDFTINGLFYDPLEDRVIDYVGGQDDLARGIIRAIGDPRARLAEDKLRLLRAVRFAATLGYQLDMATRLAIEEMADEVTRVSVERIAAEMRLMLAAPTRAPAVHLLDEVGLLDAILPEVASARRSSEPTAIGRSGDDAWLVALEVLEALASSQFPPALAALLYPFVDAKASDAICRRWKLSNQERARTHWLVANHGLLIEARRLPWPRLQRVLIREDIDDLLALDEAAARAAEQELADIEFCRQRLALPREVLDPPPLVTGDDLIAQGVPRGKEYPALLEAVRDAQLEGRISTREEALRLVDELRGRTPE